MAQYPIDIKIETAPAERGLNSLDKKLQSTAQSTIEAAEAANTLSQSQKLVNDQAVKLAQRQANAAAKTIAAAQATKAMAQEQSRLLATQASIARQAGQTVNNQSKYIQLSRTIKQATADEKKATDELTAALKRLNTAQQNTEQPIKKTTSAVDGLISTVKLLAGLAVANQVYQWGKAFVDTADKIQLLQARITLYSASQAQANDTFSQLVNIANKAGAPLENTAQVFQRFAATGQSLGIGSDRLLKFTDTLQKSAVVSGASAQEASNALYQLSQAFASGRLQGDEFRSVSEQMPILLRILAKELGVTVGQLKEMGSEGQITTDKLLLINNASDEINAQFARMPRTVEQASNALTNNLQVAIAQLDQQIGSSKYLARFLDWLAGGVADVSGMMKSAAELDKIAGATNRLNSVTEERAKNTKAIDELEASIAKGYTTNTFGGYTKFVNNTADAQAELTRRRKLDIDLAKQQLKAGKDLENSKPLPPGVAQKAGALQSDITAATVKPVQDKDVARALKTQKEQLAVARLSGVAAAQLRAEQQLGANATKEEIELARKNAAEIYNLTEAKKADKKATREQASASTRAQKELERNQIANAKYIETLKTKVAADALDLEATKVAIQLKKAESTANNDQVATIQRLVAEQSKYALAAQQKEAQSKLNKDATDKERAAVDQYVASLYRQQQAAQAAKQYGDLTTELTRAAQSPLQNELADVGAQEAQRQTVLEQARQADLVNEQEYQDTKTQIQADAEKQRQDIMLGAQGMLLGASADFFGASASLAKNYAGEQSGIYRGLFAASKAFAIAQASIALYQNVAEAMKVGFPYNIPFIAGALAQGTQILGSLSSLNFADGGYVAGPGTGRSDSIRANLSNGEFVSTAPATARYRNTLEAMNNGTYREGKQTAEPKVTVNNYGGDKVRVEKGATPDEVRVIVGEMVPTLVAGQIADPYSKSNKSLNANYNMVRRN